jgi:hypothetical protein
MRTSDAEEWKTRRGHDRERLQVMLRRYGAAEVLMMLSTEVRELNLDGAAESMRLVSRIQDLAEDLDRWAS